ncbi:hypothetical protein Bbelb_238170 [Branchiostoma belcheri]|nr:hypothetical protein Bbelb_238170 [Branchiostoma belcheri]
MSHTELSAVVDGFRELDLIFQSGSDLDVVERGYARKLVQAIVDGNKRLQIESLKSLGDVYLEKGRIGKDEAAFTESAGLYRAALDRCEDSDGRETLLHRIKYMEKVKEKERKRAASLGIATSGTLPRKRQRKRLQTASTRNKKVENSSEGAQKSLTGSEYKDRLQNGCRALQTGDLDTAEQHFAAALKAIHLNECNCRLVQFQTQISAGKVEPLCKLSDVYLKRGEQSKDGGDFTKAAALSNAALVRSKAKDREGIKQTTQEITQSFIKHVLSIEQTVPMDDVKKHKSMLLECRDYVENELKRIEKQIDPYSLDDNDPKIREVEKKRVEANKDLFDTIVHQRRTFIAGLVDECIEVMGPPPCKYAMIGLGSQAIGLVTPYSDLEFAILIEKETETNVKYFSNLTHYLHLKVINLGETILPAMAIKSLNDFESDNDLDNWFYDSATPRGFSFDGAMPHACKTPLGRGKTCLLIRTPRDMAKVLEDDVTLHLKKGYHLATVLGNVSLITGEQGLADEYTAAWDQERTKTGSDIARLIADTTLKENVQTFKEQELSARLLDLGNAWSNLGDHRQAASYHEQALQMKRSIYRKGIAHPDIALSLNNLGAAWSELGDHKKAISYYEQSLQMKRSIYGKGTAHLGIAFTLNNLVSPGETLVTKERPEAIGYFEQALRMERSIYGEGTAHPDIATSLKNLGSAGEISVITERPSATSTVTTDRVENLW